MEYKGTIIYQTPEEITNLRELVRETNNVKGVIAEVGVFDGASAQVIREETDKELYLFDTFTGFPDKLDDSDPQKYKIGDCETSIESVQTIFKDDTKTKIIKGVFPDSGGIIKDKKFSFVHIDVDIYTSTKESLEFFSKRMSTDSAILVHDYPAHSGVKKALDEFSEKYNLPIKVLGGRQAVIKFNGTS